MANELITDNFAVYEDDCLEVMPHFPDKSIHFSIYSPPFGGGLGGLYHYSSSPRDLSNNQNYAEFLYHYDFVVSEIARLTMPGRITAVHCMDTPRGNTGKSTDYILDFPGDIIELHVRCRKEDCTAPEMERRNGICGHGWFGYTARHCIWKEPLAVRNRTMSKKLAHKTIVKDSSLAGVAGADYLLIFRRSGENKEPISHPNGLLVYAGKRQIPPNLIRYRGWEGNQIENKYSHWIWRQYASSFWDDIRIDNVLPFRESKEEDDEKHVHPLQLDVIDRALDLYSNIGDKVLTPFMGVGSEVYSAVKAHRVGIGIELKESYFKQAIMNLETVKQDDLRQPNFLESLEGA
jgi:DNA modification methylase